MLDDRPRELARQAIGNALRSIRGAADVPQADLAAALGIAPRVYRAIELGRRELRFTEALAAADVLGFSPEALARAAGVTGAPRAGQHDAAGDRPLRGRPRGSSAPSALGHVRSRERRQKGDRDHRTAHGALDGVAQAHATGSDANAVEPRAHVRPARAPEWCPHTTRRDHR